MKSEFEFGAVLRTMKSTLSPARRRWNRRLLNNSSSKFIKPHFYDWILRGVCAIVPHAH